jgi:hypothetical protein
MSEEDRDEMQQEAKVMMMMSREVIRLSMKVYKFENALQQLDEPVGASTRWAERRYLYSRKQKDRQRSTSKIVLF